MSGVAVGLFSILAAASAHLIAGLVLGHWFRFGVLFFAFAVVLLESLFGDFRLHIGAWFALFVGGIILVHSATSVRPSVCGPTAPLIGV